MSEPRDQRAHWVAPRIIAWPEPLDGDHQVALHHEPAAIDHQPASAEDDTAATADGGRAAKAGTAPLAPAVTLPLRAGVALPRDLDDRARHLRGATGLALADTVPLATIRALLRGHLSVVVTDGDGRLVDRTGLQVPFVLDALYASAAEAVALGVTWDDSSPTLRLWAPTACAVRLHRFDDPQPPDPARPLAGSHPVPLHLDLDSGVWAVTGEPGWDRSYYLYELLVVMPGTGRLARNVVTDPYARSLSADSTRAQLVDLADPTLAPPGFWTHPTPPVVPMLPVIYELHVRDHSAHDPDVPPEHVGRFLAFTHPRSTGMRHLAALADAGLTHVQLLPVTDFATVRERREDQVVPDIAPPEDPASEEPQARIAATRDRQAHAWGYDPFHPGVPEGSYATDPDGPARIVELRQAIQALHATGLRVVLDVVFNHTVATGRDRGSVLDQVVPGYYHRRDLTGRVEDSTCCPNLAPEHRLAGRYVVDTVADLARFYRVDGFRFDLMGHHPRANLLAVRAALDAVVAERAAGDPATPPAAPDQEVLCYGEGWDFGEVAGGARFTQATQQALAGTGIGTFDDRLRDGVRGGGPGRDPRDQGWATGLGTAPSDHDQGDAASCWRRAVVAQRWIQVSLAGALADIELPIGADPPVVRRGDEVHYHALPAGYTRDPVERIGYVSAHDDETLFDAIALKAPLDLPLAELVAMQHVALAVALLGQGQILLHAGCELLRSKSLDRDSYASGDWFNQLDLTRRSHGFGRGLPPAEKNGERWPLLRAVLRSRPPVTTAEIDATFEHVLDLLTIRRGSSAFTLRSGAQVRERLRFHLVDGREIPGLLVWELRGAASLRGPGADRMDPVAARDPDLLVVASARPEAETVPLPGDDRAWRLHPVQARRRGSRAAAVQVTSEEVTVPPRTVAVLLAAD